MERHVCFSSNFYEQFPTFFVMPGGIRLSICRACDPSNFMVCKCNFLQLKGAYWKDEWKESVVRPRLGGWVAALEKA